MSVVIAWARMTTDGSMPCVAANSGEQITAAAAPQVGGQHWRRVSGSKIAGEAMTCSTVTGVAEHRVRDCSPRACGP